MQSNLFERAQTRASRNTTWGLVLFLLGLGILGLLTWQVSQARSQTVPFAGLTENRGQMVDAPLIWFDAGFAQSDDPERWYHFAQTEDFQVFVVEADGGTHRALADQITQDPRLDGLQTVPYPFRGFVAPVRDDLKPFIAQQWASFGDSETPTLPQNDARMNLMVSQAKGPSLPWWGSAFILMAIAGFIVLVFGRVTARSVTKSKQAVQEALPDLYDFADLDTKTQLQLENLKLRVYEPLLISDNDSIVTADLRQTAWAYVQKVRSRYSTIAFLMLHQVDKKVRRMQLPGSHKTADERIQPLWDYLRANHPDIQLGYGKEQNKEYKQRVN